MGFFKWLDNHIRESNEKWAENFDKRSEGFLDYENRRKENERARKKAEEEYLNSIECCANCYWFNHAGYRYGCRRHDFEFNLSEIVNNNIHYKKTCMYFSRG